MISLTRLAILFLFLVAGATAQAQVVRGQVTEERTGAQLAGVLVTLEHADGTTAVQVLSGEGGGYAIRVPAPGQYLVTAKRIGVARFVSELLRVGAGESRRLDITLSRVAQVLPEVRVLYADLCVGDERDRASVAALWEEARTAMLAAEVSLRDSLFEARVSRYARSLDPRTLRVLQESWGELQGVIDRPFGLLSADSLSRIGYRHEVGDEMFYHALDAAILLDPAFLRDHCFSPRNARDHVGLAFEPELARALPDVAGTVWMDERTFELRVVEYRYTGIGSFPGSDRVGGEVHFSRLPSGAWTTSRWFQRIPAGARFLSPVDAIPRLPAVILRPAAAVLLEEGGIVQVIPRRQ
jgi:hypothetical protein